MGDNRRHPIVMFNNTKTNMAPGNGPSRIKKKAIDKPTNKSNSLWEWSEFKQNHPRLPYEPLGHWRKLGNRTK